MEPSVTCMHMLRDFHIPRDMHLSRGVHMSRQTVGHAMPEADAHWLFNLQPSFLADSFCNSSFYFHRETTDKLVHEWLERASPYLKQVAYVEMKLG